MADDNTDSTFNSEAPIFTPTSVTISVLSGEGRTVRLTLRRGRDRVHLWTQGTQVASVHCAALRQWLRQRGGRRPLIDNSLRLSASDLGVYLEVYPEIAPTLVEGRTVDHLRELAID